MKKISLLLLALVAGAITFQSCEDQDDNSVPVNDYIWKGLNAYYLWQGEVPLLADNRFANQEQLNNYLQPFGSPEELFDELLYRPGQTDRFSVIFPDYGVLENLLQGVSKSNGLDYGLAYVNSSDNGSATAPVYGFVRYTMPNSDAAIKGVMRGELFYAVNGVALTAANYQDLLSLDTYTLNFATLADGIITPDGRDVTLNKSAFSENPVNTVSTQTIGSHTIGYIMYTGFYSNYDSEVNAAFGQLQSAGITDLVLDLRYNGGGSVRTATYLGSMITGQFTGQLFAKQQWNAKLQAKYESENPDALRNLFTDRLSDNTGINSLNLSKVYILTSDQTASASELVINCLKPYIEVVQIGGKTVGKNVGSVTLYDSPDFTREKRSVNHRYAMQPIVIRTVNKDNFGEYSSGITPDVRLTERVSRLGTLGETSEPFYAAAVARITASGRYAEPENDDSFKPLKDVNVRRFKNEMYIESTPENN